MSEQETLSAILYLLTYSLLNELPEGKRKQEGLALLQDLTKGMGVSPTEGGTSPTDTPGDISHIDRGRYWTKGRE